MFEIVLFQPEIPPNTGNIIRLSANAGCRLHLVKPYGFHLDDRTLARAGLDYDTRASLVEHLDWASCRKHLARSRLFAFTSRGTQLHTAPRYGAGDALVFGPETRGLPAEVLDSIEPSHRLRIPMRPGNRSLNLSNAVAIAVYEAWRQAGFAGHA